MAKKKPIDLDAVDVNALVLDESLADVVDQLADDYDDMSLEDLDALSIELSTDRLRLHIRQLAVHAALDRKAHAAQAERMTENLTDPQKAALMQHLTVPSVDADEMTGEPAMGDEA